MDKICSLYFEKYANFDRTGEPCSTALPLPKGRLKNAEKIVIRSEDGRAFPTQTEVTALWDDGSIKWVYIDFICDLPKNRDITYYICADGEKTAEKEISYNIIKLTAVIWF